MAKVNVLSFLKIKLKVKWKNFLLSVMKILKNKWNFRDCETFFCPSRDYTDKKNGWIYFGSKILLLSLRRLDSRCLSWNRQEVPSPVSNTIPWLSMWPAPSKSWNPFSLFILSESFAFLWKSLLNRWERIKLKGFDWLVVKMGFLKHLTWFRAEKVEFCLSSHDINKFWDFVGIALGSNGDFEI